MKLDAIRPVILAGIAVRIPIAAWAMPPHAGLKPAQYDYDQLALTGPNSTDQVYRLGQGIS